MMFAVWQPMYSTPISASWAGMFQQVGMVQKTSKETATMNSKIQANPIHALPGPDDIVRVELNNGLIVLVRENFTSPSVVVDGLLWGGALWESPDKAGLANFHSDM